LPNVSLLIRRASRQEKGRRRLLTLEDGSKVDGSTGTHSLGVVALLEETVDTTDGELETSLGGSRDGLLAVSTFSGRGLSRLSLARPEGKSRGEKKRRVSKRRTRAQEGSGERMK
jgi:hypothetical protein